MNSDNFSIRVFDLPETVATSVAKAIIKDIETVLLEKDNYELVLTGGTLGILTLKKLSELTATTDFPWEKIHLWWSDERWVESNSSDRNYIQAITAMSETLAKTKLNFHPMPASDEITELAQAATAYQLQLAEYFNGIENVSFDLCLLGVGPDGHIASLFPNHEALEITGKAVIPVTNSPKPPPNRISFSFELINSSEKVWFVASGIEKSSALAEAVAGVSKTLIPMSGVRAKSERILFTDETGASKLKLSKTD